MNIKVLKTFCDAADTGSFSRAAQMNGVTQSAVSQQLAGLERELNVVLLNRGGGAVTPTEAGRALYEGAREVLHTWERTLGQLRSTTDKVRGVVRVGTIYSVGFDVLHPYVRRFLQAYPEANLQIEYTRWTRINAEVIRGEMNLGVVAYPQRHRSLEVLPFVEQELVVVTDPPHRLAGRKSVRPEDLAGEPFVAFENQIPTRVHIDRELKRHKVSVTVSSEFDNIETLKRAVEVGVGVSIVPRDNVTREVAAGVLCALRFRERRGWTRQIGIIRRVGRERSPAEQAFLDLLTQPGGGG